MATAVCDQLAIGKGLGSANAGLGGANLQGSPTENDTAIRVKRFTFTIPASGAGSAQNDVITIGLFNVLARFIAATVFVPAGGLGAGTTLSIGKVDPNNAANTDAVHYANAVSSAAAAVIEADTNITEQFGAAPTGAATDTGNAPLPGAPGGGYGNAPIQMTLTIGGGAPTAAVQLQGFILYAADEA